MKDRVPTYPGRVILTPVAGAENTYDLVRADEPTQEGMALSKANLLDDETANTVWLDADEKPSDPTPSQALTKLATQHRASLVRSILVPTTNNTALGVFVYRADLKEGCAYFWNITGTVLTGSLDIDSDYDSGSYSYSDSFASSTLADFPTMYKDMIPLPRTSGGFAFSITYHYASSGFTHMATVPYDTNCLTTATAHTGDVYLNLWEVQL